MNAAPVLRAAAGGLARRPVQTAVLFVVLLASCASATLGLTLYTSANVGFLENFAKYHGAQLAVYVDAKRATPQALAGTTRLSEVTGSAGPYPATTVMASTTPSVPGTPHTGPRAGQGDSQPLTIVGRARAENDQLDDPTVLGGRWAAAAGEIVLAPYNAGFAGFPVGSTLTVLGLAGKSRLLVTGKGSSAARDEPAWMTPGGIIALESAGAPAELQMLYTFRSAATAVEIDADLKAIEAALPAGAVIRSVSWLQTSNHLSGIQGINTPFVLAFALLAMVLAALITAAVVSGMVVAGYRRIGVLKSIGFTPVQVTAAYLLQFLVPAAGGCVAGVALGHAWVLPMIDAGQGLFQVSFTIPLWVTLAAPAATIAIAAVAGLVPAVRAGRLGANAAIVAGQAPPASTGQRAQRVFAGLPAPRPVTLGLAAPFARPGRSALTAVVVCSGVAAVVLAAGLNSSVSAFTTLPLSGEGQAQVTLADGDGPSLAAFSSRQRTTVTSALAALPGTGHAVAGLTIMSGLPGVSSVLSLPGLQFPLLTRVYDGDSRWLQGTVVAGTWYHQAGQVDVNHEFVIQTGLAVGTELTLSADGHLVRTTIVGEVFEAGPPELFASSATFAGTPLATAITQYDIGLRPGTDAAAFMTALTRKLGSPAYAVTGPLRIQADGLRNVDTSLIGRLTMLVAALAALGVLNAMIMMARERVRDLGVVKAIGMTSRQIVSMVLCWAVVPAAVAAVIAVPAGLVLHGLAIDAIGAQTGIGVAGPLIDVYQVSELALLALTSLGLAALGSLGPAVWAAVSRTTAVLRTE